MKSPSTTWLSCLVLAAATAGSLGAQTRTSDKPEPRFGNPTAIARIYQDYVYGVIKKIAPKENELIVDKTVFGNSQIFTLTSRTKYVRDGKKSSLKDLKVGEEVYIATKRDKKTGAKIAKKIVTGVLPTG